MESITSYQTDELLSDHAFFVQPTPLAPANNAQVPAATSARVSELEDEVTRLRAQLAKAKSVNDAMWENIVQRVIADGKEKMRTQEAQGADGAMDVDGEGDMGEQRRKRGRT